VINSKLVAVTGRKRQQKVYRHHTGGPGGLKEIPFEEMMEKKPEEVCFSFIFLIFFFFCSCSPFFFILF